VDFYGPWTPPGAGVIATGRTGRDFKTFALAAACSSSSATIIGLRGQLDDPAFRGKECLRVIEAPNEEPVPGERRGWLKYPELCSHMRSHAAIAIPLFAQSSLAGVTSLMDALGLGRAILMTRNVHVDVDIEAERIGFWLEPGDVRGWADRLKWIAANPVEVAEMGERARRLAEQRLNSAAFAHGLTRIFERALGGPPEE
jgi:glycosyltransferase involved in cell wall biosynthesis